MQIDSNLSPNTVARTTPAATSAAKAVNAQAADSVSFAQAEAINKSLKEEPDVRSSEVERAQNLIGQVQWPPEVVIRRFSNLLAIHMASENE